jgi:hypothetical protein
MEAKEEEMELTCSTHKIMRNAYKIVDRETEG